ncbi:site-specific DNA-methyltransferase [bacterium]|nr:site-specific DNA-methyltransferase [bacterium]
MSNIIKKQVYKVLNFDERLWNKEKTELNQTLLLDLVEHIDEKIIDLLLQETDLREKFFVKIKDAYVFKTNEFRFFMEENKIDNSYTIYKNRIGLTDGKRFLKDTNDVVLDFPYKDCVLEGGQSTEEGTDTYFEYNEKAEQYEEKKSKRKEIFFNSVLAHDEIDRLFDPKALTNWKRFTKDGEQEVKEIKREKDGTIKENLIIKGNNLLALHSLKKQFAGKVKLIYIDPPYNPPSSNNTFTYNNNFNHSTWLTFMKNRLDVGKKLLSEDGAFIVAIDENEVSYLGVMIEELFPEYENHCITIVHNPRGIQGTNFSYTHEYAYFIFPKGKKIIGNRKIEEENIDFSNLRNWGSESERTDAKNCFYPILVDKCTNQIIDFGEICNDDFHPSINIHKGDFVEIYPIDLKGIERKWRYARQSVEEIKDLLKVKITKGIYDIQIGKDFGKYRTVWIDKKYDANEYGTKIVNSLVKDNTFSFPKSLWNVYDCIYAVVGNDKNAIVLDYHAGSGTTAHAVLELNKDGGNRKFIMIEQMDYINTITCPRVQKVMEKENIDNSFIYFELAKWNETAKEKIQEARSLDELETFFDEMYERYFLNYNLKINEFKEKVLQEENFRNLSLDEQKKIFFAMLDNNQMYVNKTEIADKKFGISEEDQNLTSQFYNSEK